MPKYEMVPFGWTSRFPAPPGFCGRDTVNGDTAAGYLRFGRGFDISQTVALGATSAAGSWVHTTESGKQYVWSYRDDSIYSVATPIATSLTSKFNPVVASLGTPCDMSVWFNGTDAQAQLIRENSGGTNVEAVLFNSLTAPTVPASTINAASGSWSGGTYQLRMCWVDKTGPVNVFSAPGLGTAEVISASDQVVVNRPSSPPARATHWRYAFSAAGGSDTPSAYIYWADVAVATTTATLNSLPADAGSQAFSDRGGTYLQGTMPISNVDIGWIHEERLFIASTKDNQVAWSERNNINQWYSDQVTNVGGAPIVGGISHQGIAWVFTKSGIHAVYGSLRRDDQGSNATYAVDVDAEIVTNGVGCVSHNSIFDVGGTIYFFSTRGPAVFSAGRVALIRPDDVEPFLHCIDWTYAARICGAEDPDLNMACWIVPRQTNSSRPMDGASVAGICDWWLRYDYAHSVWSPPRLLDAVHLSLRTDGSQGNQNLNQPRLMACSPHTAIYEMNVGNAGGVAGDVSGTLYDSKLATSQTTTSVTFTQSGVSADDHNDQTVTLRYPSDDDTYPGMLVQKTILDTAVSGSAATLSWSGALTAPSGSGKWTVRIAGQKCYLDMPHDPREYGAPAEPGTRFIAQTSQAELRDVVGSEAVA